MGLHPVSSVYHLVINLITHLFVHDYFSNLSFNMELSFVNSCNCYLFYKTYKTILIPSVFGHLIKMKENFKKDLLAVTRELLDGLTVVANEEQVNCV